MFKTLRDWCLAFGVGAVFLLGAWANAQAAVVTNTTDQLLNAVNEVTSTLRVDPFTQLSIFVSGTYAAGNTVVLQREAGSPGSGAFEDVLTVTNGTANARVSSLWTTGPNPSSYRLKMSATGTGAVVAYLTDWPVTAVTWVTNADQIVLFDDFNGINSASTTALNASRYVTQDSDTNSGIPAVMSVAIQEGGVLMIGGLTVDNGACMSAITSGSFGALVTDGTMAFELRLRTGALDGKVVVALVDTACVADTVPIVDVDSGTVATIDAGSESFAGFVRQDEATALTDWIAVSAINDVEGANALEVPIGITAVDTYVILRVEIDSAGNGYWYVNNSLVHAEPLAVTLTARLIPNFLLMETALNAGEVTGIVDTWMFVVVRPAS